MNEICPNMIIDILLEEGDRIGVILSNYLPHMEHAKLLNIIN